jgi:ElaB/YqjD/DUF883 family membrane-anchored ribosome-binding protein
MEREDFIRQWKEGKISSDDLDRKLRESPDNREVKELKDIISRSTELRVPQKRTKEEAWSQFTDRIESQQQPPEKVVHMKPWLALSIAASLLLLIIFIVWIWIK